MLWLQIRHPSIYDEAIFVLEVWPSLEMRTVAKLWLNLFVKVCTYILEKITLSQLTLFQLDLEQNKWLVVLPVGRFLQWSWFISFVETCVTMLSETFACWSQPSIPWRNLIWKFSTDWKTVTRCKKLGLGMVMLELSWGMAKRFKLNHSSCLKMLSNLDYWTTCYWTVEPAETWSFDMNFFLFLVNIDIWCFCILFYFVYFLFIFIFWIFFMVLCFLHYIIIHP